MASKALSSSTPMAAARTAAMAALARLNRPGRPSRKQIRPPPARARLSPSSHASERGRASPQEGQLQSSPSKRIRASQAGQPPASSLHAWPAATQVTWDAADAAQATMGSSQLATTRSRGRPATAARQRAPSERTSLTRSSWSRLRLSSATATGLTSSTTCPSHASSTSKAPAAPAGAWARAATRPAGRLEPVWLLTTGPAVARAEASSRVVVVFPLVPLTRPSAWPPASWRRAPGSRARVTRPPITLPEPRPRRRRRPPRPGPGERPRPTGPAGASSSRAARRQGQGQLGRAGLVPAPGLGGEQADDGSHDGLGVGHGVLPGQAHRGPNPDPHRGWVQYGRQPRNPLRAGPHPFSTPQPHRDDGSTGHGGQPGGPGLAHQHRVEESPAPGDGPLGEHDHQLPRLEDPSRLPQRLVRPAGAVHPDPSHGPGQLTHHRGVEDLLLAEEARRPPPAHDGHRERHRVEVAPVVRHHDPRSLGGDAIDRTDV